MSAVRSNASLTSSPRAAEGPEQPNVLPRQGRRKRTPSPPSRTSGRVHHRAALRQRWRALSRAVGVPALGDLAQGRLVELVCLRLTAPAAENGFHGEELLGFREHADRGPAATQRSAEALAIGVVEPEVLMVQLAQQRATGRPDAEADG